MKQPKRTRRNDPSGARNRALDAAAELFQARGYHATGTREILNASGLSSGAFHHHFPTKDALAMAVITDRIAPAVRATWIDPIREGRSMISAIRHVFAAIIRGIDRQGAVRGCPLNNLAMELSFSNAQFRDALGAVFREWQGALMERIANTRGGARLDKQGCAAAAGFIVSAYSGAMNLAKTTQSSVPLRVAAQNLAEWMRERDFAERYGA
jgi:TetR/AcrR family transcriptional regulator, transcriptional repressor for nem operon